MKVTFRLIVSLIVVYGLMFPAGVAYGVPVISSNKENNAEVEGYHKIDAICYHIKSTDAVYNALSKTQYGKPIIVSDDGARASTSNVHQWTGIVKNAGQHYEHLSDALVECWGGAWNGCAQRGKAINSISDFPSEARTNLARLGSLATPLAPYGTLTRVGNQFRWNDQPIALMGYSWYGAMIGLNCNIPGYLGVLQSYGVNMTRVWVIDNYTAYAEGTNFNNGVIPFTGSFGSYDLYQLNDAFFTRMKQFVDEAWARGIVVQLVLFDRCCLQCGKDMRFNHSPYNTKNNVNDFLPNCTSGYPNFCQTDGSQIGAVNRALIERCVQELAGRGNVLWEIMNEPGSSSFPNDVAWHKWVADVIHESYDTEPPSVPTDVEATSWGSTLMEITWTASTDNIAVAGYRVFRDGTEIGIATSTEYLDTGLTASTTYSYTVSAYDAIGNESEQSTPAAGTSLDFDPEPPSVPTNVTAIGVSNSSIQIGWTASTDNRGVLGYRLFRDGALIDTIGLMTTYTDSGLSAGTSYSYTVSAYDGDGNESAQSFPPAVGTTFLAPEIIWQETFSSDPFAAGTWHRSSTDIVWQTYGGVPCLNCETNNRTATYNHSFTTENYMDLTLSVRYRTTGSSGDTYIEVWGMKDGSWSHIGNCPAANTESWVTRSWNLSDGDWSKVRLTWRNGSTWNQRVDRITVMGVPSAQPAVITSHPMDQTKLVGETATFSITAAGSPILTYQWELDTGTGWEAISEATNSSYTTPILVLEDSGNAYRCVVTNPYGSATSNAAILTVTTDTEAPSVPTSVTATALSDSEIRVDWTASTDNVGVAGYRIFRNGTEVGSTGDSTSYTDSGLQDATVYTYTVSAFDAASNESAQSAPATATTFDATPPSIPADVQGVPLTPRVVKLTWTASTDNVGVSGYKVFRDGVEIATTAEIEYLDTELLPDTTYLYTVSAYDESQNESAQSPPAVVDMLAAMSIAEVKQQEALSVVGMVSKMVSAVLDDCIYVQEDDRYTGVMIVPLDMPDGLRIGSRVDIGGVVDTNEDEERYVLGHVVLH